MSEAPVLTPSQFIDITNQTMEAAFPSAMIVGEVASFKTSQGKWVFFDLKDESASVSCFLPIWNLRMPLEDGMKVVVVGVPKLTKWGRFSVTVSAVKPVGEGSLKKAYEMLKKKLTAEGLFDASKKRPLPENLARLGVISSTGAAGYADFIKILNARWGGIRVSVAHTQVQGMDAPDQIIRALNYFNERGEVEVIAILRGGGSADDLSAFNDEKLVRAIAASKIPVITGVGHEVDESLADLAADVRASTPSNAAEMLTKGREFERRKIQTAVNGIGRDLLSRVATMHEMNVAKMRKVSQGLTAKYIEPMEREVQSKVFQISQSLINKYIEPMERKVNEMVRGVTEKTQNGYERGLLDVRQKIKMLEMLNPEKVLKQGYAILSGKISPGNAIKITTFTHEVAAEVKEVRNRQ
ncbi:exodeoxyribonuclease VII large subunit [Candidatus Saccharibacteria bacterium]|nr:exodeoxyribonuclease VII large subunit [Candidatus Saccharibacteria bacterium]